MNYQNINAVNFKRKLANLSPKYVEEVDSINGRATSRDELTAADIQKIIEESKNLGHNSSVENGIGV